MGCTTSVLPLNKRPGQNGEPNGSIEDEREMAIITAPAPKVLINVGSGLRRYQEKTHNIVFVFGGPCSMKGLLVEELVAAFNFSVITTEDIVLSYLPNKVANTVQTTQEIKDLLQTDPSMLSLEWVLNLVAARLTTNSPRLFLVDIVPNMHTILRLETFNKPDIRKEMSDFERKFPSLFALNLVVSEDKLSNAYVAPGIAMKFNRPTVSGAGQTQSNDDDPCGDKEKIDKDKEKEKGKSLFTEGSDEMDSSRMKRRHDLYQSCADPFVAYFEDTDRVATVHVAPFQKDYVWKRIYEFFREIGFPSKKGSRTVLLFAFNEEQVEGLDTLYYKMLKVSLSAIISNKNDTLENMIKAISLYVKRCASSTNHLIILDCLNTKMDIQLPRRINFLEVREYYLDHFIKIKSTTMKGRPFRKRFRAITATNNEVCLFPAPKTTDDRGPTSIGDTELCKKIAFSYLIADQPIPLENGSSKDEEETASGTDGEESDRLISNRMSSSPSAA